MAIYEGKININCDPSGKGVYINRGNDEATLSASDAVAILDTMVKAADQHKCGIDRWSLYIPELTAKLSKDDKQLPVAKVKAYMDGSREPALIARRSKTRDGRTFVSPQIFLTSPVKVVKESKIIKIA